MTQKKPIGQDNYSNAELWASPNNQAKEQLKTQPSKVMHTKNSVALSSGDRENITISERVENSKKYGQMTDLIVDNLSDCDILIWINQDEDNSLLVPAKASRGFGSAEIGGAYSSYSIENINGVLINVSEIRCSHFHRGKTAEDSLNKSLRKFSGFLK